MPELMALVLKSNTEPFTVGIPADNYVWVAGQIISGSPEPARVVQSICRDGSVFLLSQDVLDEYVPLNLPGTLLGNYVGYRDSNVFGPLVVLGPRKRDEPQSVPGAILEWVQDYLLCPKIENRELSSLF